MKVSIIAAVYKNVKALELILEAMRRQTYRDFEVLVAEDDQSPEVQALLSRYDDLEIVHVSHPDNGLQKNIIQNKAIAAASGAYLIFIDGDCVPYEHFIENNVKMAKPKRVLSGRRVNLPEGITGRIYGGALSPADVEKHYLFYGLSTLAWDKEVRFEQGIYLDPDGFVYKQFVGKKKRNTELLGCNFSCFKEDMLTINGFDESYGDAILGDDTDLTWRFRASGCEMVSSKNVCNVFHLYHPARPAKPERDISHLVQRFEQRKDEGLYRVEDEYGVSKYL